MKKTLILLVGLCFLLMAGPVSADDLFPPNWWPNPGSMVAEWDTWQTDGSPDAWSTWDDEYPWAMSPYFYGDGYTKEATYQNREDVVQLLFNDGITFYMPNYGPNDVKYVRIQVTYFDAPGGDVIEPYGFNVWTTGDPTLYLADETFFNKHEWRNVDTQEPTGWITAAYDFAIIPNPLEEFIGLKFSDYFLGNPDVGVYIDQVVIDTWCTTGNEVPIPGAIWLLGSGLIGLVGLRRKFQG